jgi:flagellar basal-body rod protein FlgB
MDGQNITLLSALKSRMGWLTDRQKLVAQNVANASTPGYKPKDLTAQNFAALMQGDASAGNLAMTRTSAMHIEPNVAAPSGAKEVVTPDSETTMDGNSVVLEEQMLKMSESRLQFQAAVSFYEKSMNMVRMAGRAPGK